MLLAAEAAGARGVTLLPVGLVFDEPGTFRSGRALVLVGAPVDTSGLAGRDPLADPAAGRALTDRLTDALRAQIVETDDRQTLHLLKLVEELWRERDDAPPLPEGMRVFWLQGAARAHRTLVQRAPDRVAAFRAKLEAYDAECEKAGLGSEQLSRWYTAASVARYVASEGLSLLVGLPLAMVGLLVHGIPYRLTSFVVRMIPHTDEEEATDKIAGGLVLYPLCWIAEGWALFALFGKAALIAFLVAVPVTAFPALAWYERLRRARTEASAFGRFLVNRSLLRRLRTERRELSGELHALAELADSAAGGPA
jgi:hypothetical protein